MYESDDKMVSHPTHYQSKNGLEVIDVIEAFTEGLFGIEATDTGNILKYICRWKNKNGIQDLEKAQWYLTHLIEKVKENLNRNMVVETEPVSELELLGLSGPELVLQTFADGSEKIVRRGDKNDETEISK